MRMGQVGAGWTGGVSKAFNGGLVMKAKYKSVLFLYCCCLLSAFLFGCLLYYLFINLYILDTVSSFTGVG